MYDEEDWIRAETSRILDDGEVQEQVQLRGAELALGCDGPLTLHALDVTSTPRPDRFKEYNEESHALTPSPEQEILRSGRQHERSLQQEDTDEAMPNQEDTANLPQSGRLDLDEAGIGALTDSLRQA